MTTQGLALQQHVQQLLRDQLIHPQVFFPFIFRLDGRNLTPLRMRFLPQLQNMLLYQKQQQEKLADLGRKQLETVMQQLQEQLQLNLIQQSQLMQQRSGPSSSGGNAADRRKSHELVQTLASQQQQLMQQLQLTQRHYLIGLQQQQLLTSPPASAGKTFLVTETLVPTSDGSVFVVQARNLARNRTKLGRRRRLKSPAALRPMVVVAW